VNETAKRRACATVDRLAGELIAVSRDLHAHPETAHREHRAAALLADRLARGGLAVERGAYGLPTAVAGRAGQSGGGPLVVICCEYDALPGMGHACGHNVVAAAGLGAGLALAALAGPLGGRVLVLGTPAEERGGGKILLAKRGAFDGAGAAMLIHPGPHETVMPHLIAVSTLHAILIGKAAHASMNPDAGINALDALVLGYLGVNALRQHLPQTDKVHGIITLGGTAPNVIPARTAGRFMARSTTLAGLVATRRRVEACLAAGAQAAGARLVAHWQWPTYREMRHNLPLAAAMQANLRALGRRPLAPAAIPPSQAGSTDLGNVSHLIPAVHPKLAICPPDVAQHSPAFARWAIGPAADRAILDGAKALAMTAIDIWLSPTLYPAMRADFATPPGRPSRRRCRPAPAATRSAHPPAAVAALDR